MNKLRTTSKFSQVALQIAFGFYILMIAVPLIKAFETEDAVLGFIGQPIHDNITRDGLWFLKDEVVELMVAQHLVIEGMQVNPWHFDSCAFDETTENINQLYNDAVLSLDFPTPPNSSTNIPFESTAIHFGQLLHPVQDFYAHSNWVESGFLKLVDSGINEWTTLRPFTKYQDQFWVIQGNPPSGFDLELHPSAHTVTVIEPDGTHSVGIISGAYGDTVLCPAEATLDHGLPRFLAKDTDLNKDHPSRPNYAQARTLAVLQTTHEWCRLVNLVEKAHGSAKATELIESWVRPNLSDSDKIAASCGHVETVLIIDASGSMVTNDPSRKRIDAAKAFIDAAQEGDSIAIVRFSSGATTLYGLRTILSPDDRIALKAAVDSVGQSGSTNINAALDTGFNQLLYGSATNRKVAVLLTDGDHNVGTYDPQSHLQFADQGWTLHTIGLGGGALDAVINGRAFEPEADLNGVTAVSSAFLIDIAEATGGQFFSAENANELVQVFKDISSRTTRSEEVANSQVNLVQGTTQQIKVNLQDTSTSATFFTNWNDGDVNMTLTTPGGGSITSSTISPSIYHAEAGIYELYTIEKPQNGEWTVKLEGVSVAAGGELVSTQVTVINGLAPGIDIYLPIIYASSSGGGGNPPPPDISQQFTIDVGDVVGVSTPGIGAGRIEVAGSKDIYTFTASAGQPVFFDERGASGNLLWQVKDSSGVSIIAEQPLSTSDPGLYILQKGGVYTITVRGSGDTATGTYQFRLIDMPQPQTFNIITDQVVPTDVAAVGIGRIEFLGSRDIYIFTATPGQLVYFDEIEADGSFLWKVEDANGVVVVSEEALSTSDPAFRTLTLGGTYKITVRGSGDSSVGTYKFQVLSMPAAQQFSINIDDVISDGLPAVGAGNIEAIGSKDIYTFTAVPGQSVYFDEQGAVGSIRWQIQDANGATIVSEQLLSTSDPGLVTLVLGGTYTITVRGTSDTSIGTYQFQVLSIPAPQQFLINIDDVVSNGIPGSGAGNIETVGSRDIYTFTAAPGQSVYFDEQGAVGSIRWQIQDANGTIIVSDQALSTGDPGLVVLTLGGTYFITVRGSNDNSVGTYQFQVLSIPDPQTFAIDIDEVVSNGMPGPGAGNIEVVGSKDIYTFFAAPGQLVYFDEQGASGGINWQVQDANGTIVVSDQTLSTSDAGFRTLTLGGNYTITVRGSSNSGVGTYQFQVLSMPAPQQFAINIGDVVSNGVPAAGAGNIEAIGSKDIYTFTATPGQIVYFDEQGASGSIRWEVKDANGTIIVSDQLLSTSDAGVRTLDLGGVYTITVRGSNDTGLGTYQFQIILQ